LPSFTRLILGAFGVLGSPIRSVTAVTVTATGDRILATSVDHTAAAQVAVERARAVQRKSAAPKLLASD
jgi:hypothetical protein